MSIEVLTDPDDLAVTYHDLLLPAFIPEELGSLQGLIDGVTHGDAIVTVVRDGAEITGAAVGEWFPTSRVMLLAYLAVAPNARSGGVGSRLLRETLALWEERYSPVLVIAEVEHPGFHGSDPGRGDPAARLRFYDRFGAKLIDMPYFQPALRPGSKRVTGLLLLLLAARRGVIDASGTILAGRTPLVEALREYSRDFQLPPVDESPEVIGLTDALFGEAPVRLLPVSAYDRVRFPGITAQPQS